MTTPNRRVPLAALPILLCALALLALAAPASARAQRGGPRVTSTLSTGLVTLGQQARVNLHVQDAEDARVVDVPEVPGLRLVGVSGPSTERRESWINGRRSVSTSLRWIVVYEPAEEGDYVIPPIELEVDGERVQTRELSLSVRVDVEGEDLGHFEWIDLPERVYEGEPFRLRLRFGWDARTRVNYANLLLPWWGELANAIESPDPDRSLRNPTDVNLNNRSRITTEQLGEQKRDGRTLRLFEVDRRYVATRPGSIELPQGFLEFGLVEQSVFSRSKDTNHVGLDAREIEVRPLPREGQPFDFSGAVGRVSATADLDRRSVDVGESIKLGVEWSGRANLEFFDAPDPARMEAFDGFRVYGRTDEFEGDRRRVVYDLAPVRADVDEVPPLPLWVFDTEREEYARVETEAIPILVRALPGATGLEGETREGPVLDVGDVQTDPEPSGEGEGPSNTTLVLAPLGLAGAWIALRLTVRRAGDPDAPAARARRAAKRRLTRDLARAATASDQSRALRRFLAARSGETPEAWEGRPATEWWTGRAHGAAEAPPEEIRDLDRLLADLDERIWAGEDRALERERIEGVARELVGGAL